MNDTAKDIVVDYVVKPAFAYFAFCGALKVGEMTANKITTRRRNKKTETFVK